MERLTERLGDYNNPKEICAVWVKNYDYVSAAHRLADYEDIADTVGGFDRLRELAEADKGGRLEMCRSGWRVAMDGKTPSRSRPLPGANENPV